MTTLLNLRFVVAGLALFIALLPAIELHAAPAKALITRKDNSRSQGWVQNSNAEGILFTITEGTQGSGIYYKDLSEIVFLDSADIMREARIAYGKGDYKAAAEAFGRIADEYQAIAFVPGNFASEARYYQIESKRRLLELAGIANLLNSPTGKTMVSVLPEVFAPQIKIYPLWALLGANQTDQLAEALKPFQKTPLGSQKLVPTPIFQEMPPEILIQLSYLRAKVFEAAGEKKKALEDYYRTFTVSNGSEPFLIKDAMTSAMSLQSEDPRLAETESVLWQMQSLAYVYKNAYNAGDIPSTFMEYAVKPEMPDVMVQPKEEGEEAEGAEAAAEGDMKKDEAAAGDEKAGDDKDKEGEAE